MNSKLTGAEIRQSFIDFFVENQHTFVPSASLVPGGDATLLFTNAGMVQFKDVFLGTDKRPYIRAVDSQKCIRVAGKHNDLDDVGRDDYHHTFFEMLGNWSFGDYYKKEAIAWAWQLLTEVWGLPKEKIYATCFRDEQGDIPTDDEAAEIWKKQPGFNPSNLLFFGRKENFWEMAETGPCGPCSEIHLDRGEKFDNLAGTPHHCGVNGECQRYLELWNNVFIQYNRTGPDSLEPLPATHVDTGMGFERIVAVLQGVDSNYKIDLFQGVLERVRSLSGDTVEDMYSNFTPYRVIADHARAAAFLIADGVVPGNVGRNYICRMIIRRAARFGIKIGLDRPFLANAAEAIITAYGDFYPELIAHRAAILESISREEFRFARTLESGTAYLLRLLNELKHKNKNTLEGEKAFELYATYGLPFEITRDIAREQEQDVDEDGFHKAMEEHRLASGGGKAIGFMDGGDAGFYAGVLFDLEKSGKIGKEGIEHNPYEWLVTESPILALARDGALLTESGSGDKVEVILAKTGFYVESGGQVSDTGLIRSKKNHRDGTPEWEIEIDEVRRPSAGTIIHVGEVVFGHPKTGDKAIAIVESGRRHDIMRNHTATHILHEALRNVLGETTRQAGSLVSANRLRFDFTFPEAMTKEQLNKVEKMVNEAVAADMPVMPRIKKREDAIAEGATALFGEKYGDTVRTITIGPTHDDSDGTRDEMRSYELCGGTHLERTSDVGLFIILSEGSAAAGVRRIEAVTGRGAYEVAAQRFKDLKTISEILKVGINDASARVVTLQDEINLLRKQSAKLMTEAAIREFNDRLSTVENVNGVNVLLSSVPNINRDTLAELADKFREKFPKRGICVIGSSDGNQVIVMATVTQDLIKNGIKAGDIVGFISRILGAGGGGAPHLAFGGGRDPEKLTQALSDTRSWLIEKV